MNSRSDIRIGLTDVYVNGRGITETLGVPISDNPITVTRTSLPEGLTTVTLSLIVDGVAFDDPWPGVASDNVRRSFGLPAGGGGFR